MNPKIDEILKEIERRISLRIQSDFSGQLRLRLEVNINQGGIGESFLEENTKVRLKFR
jgi:hypothetical protein